VTLKRLDSGDLRGNTEPTGRVALPCPAPLWKYHGAQNDFFIVEASPPECFTSLSDLRRFARELCHRTAGLGADGLVFLRLPSPLEGSVEALIVNSDGSLAGTCGNALRCIGLHAARHHGWSGRTPLPVARWVSPLLTRGPDGAGPNALAADAPAANALAADEGDLAVPGVFARVLALRTPKMSGTFESHPGDAEVDVAMGKALRSQIVPLPPAAREALAEAAPGFAWEDAHAVFVELSNPHLVIAAPGLDALSTDTAVRVGLCAQRALPSLLAGVPLSNIGLLSLSRSEGMVTCRVPAPLVVFERGAGLTQCCGSGATAARIALDKLRILPSSGPQGDALEADIPWVSFAMPGGVVSIGTEGASGGWVLRGPAVFVGEARFSGASVSRFPA
jgi:diaminopimelate epimerase